MTPEDDNTCAICLEDISETELHAQCQICRKRLHATCFCDYVNYHNSQPNISCPSCRTVVITIHEEVSSRSTPITREHVFTILCMMLTVLTIFMYLIYVLYVCVKRHHNLNKPLCLDNIGDVIDMLC